MAVYNFNEVGPDGKVLVAHVVEMRDDAEAFVYASALGDHRPVHIWEGSRFVAGLPPGTQPPLPRTRARRAPIVHAHLGGGNQNLDRQVRPAGPAERTPAAGARSGQGPPLDEVHYGVVYQNGAWVIVGENLNFGSYRTRAAAERGARRLASKSAGLPVELHVQDETGELQPPDHLI